MDKINKQNDKPIKVITTMGGYRQNEYEQEVKEGLQKVVDDINNHFNIKCSKCGSECNITLNFECLYVFSHSIKCPKCKKEYPIYGVDG